MEKKLSQAIEKIIIVRLITRCMWYFWYQCFRLTKFRRITYLFLKKFPVSHFMSRTPPGADNIFRLRKANDMVSQQLFIDSAFNIRLCSFMYKINAGIGSDYIEAAIPTSRRFITKEMLIPHYKLFWLVRNVHGNRVIPLVVSFSSFFN